MPLLGAFKRKQDASFNIEPAYEPETEAKGELDFVKGQAETKVSWQRIWSAA